MKTQAYFEDIQEHLLVELNSATNSICIAVAWFTDNVLFEALCTLAEKNIKIELVLMNDNINKASGINYSTLTQKGGKVWMIGNETTEEKLMHNKFCVIDQSTVISGSYNWTNKAKQNHESITIINENSALALDFLQEFQKIKEKYFGKSAETVILDYGKLCVRFEILKNAILLEDSEDIKYQIDKIQALIKADAKDKNNESILTIIQNTKRKNFGESVRLINDFVAKFKQITIYIDSELAALRLEIRSLELQISSIDDEKTEIEKTLRTFEIRHNRELGDLILKILKLRKEKLKKETISDKNKHKEFEEAENDFNEFQNNFNSTKNEKILTLSDEQKKQIKDLYRRASKLCHPDKVPDEQKEEAEKIFKELGNAYKKNDLQKVSELFNNLDKGIFLSNSETICEKDKLLILVQQHRMKRDKIEEALNSIKNSSIYKTVSGIEKWDDYFKDTKEKLYEQLKQLESIKI